MNKTSGRSYPVDAPFGGYGGKEAKPPSDFTKSKEKIKRVGSLVLDLTTARTDERFEVNGNVLWADTSAAAANNVTIKLGSIDNAGIYFTAGKFISGFPFNEIFVTNAVQAAGSSITLLYMTDEMPRVDMEL